MKRIISLMLSLVIILSLVCVAAPGVSAATTMKTSEQCITLLKTFEGFAKYPYQDNGSWTVGYGTIVTGNDLKKYQEEGITEAEADKLMRASLKSFETSVNNFTGKHGLKLSQSKFDALISFTYNLGASWMSNTDHLFTKAVVNGTTGNDFIFAITQWCKASGSVLGSLINRRLCEANLYLNGVYSTTVPANYRYVIYSANAEDAVTDLSVQGFDSTKSVSVLATATRAGYQFLGWYTKAAGGAEVSKLSYKTSVNKLYAHWQRNGGEVDEKGNIVGVPASYECYAATVESQKIYDAPGGEVIKNVKGTTKLTVVAEHLDSAGVKWGKLASGNWFKVSAGIDFAPVVEDPESVIDPITVTVISSGVNNRVGPGTNYAKQGTFTKGQKLVLTAVQKGGKYKWGKSEEGWICLDYTDYETVVVMSSPEATKVTAIGTVIKTDVLNVRAGAGAQTAKVGTYKRGDQVKITLRQKVGSNTWGLTEKGWISLYYVKLTEVKDGQVPDIEFPDNSGGSTTPGGSGNSGETGDGTTVIKSGKIVNCNNLRIRAGAGTRYAVVGQYAKGTYVNIYETTSVGVDVWGRTEKGWICLRYVELDAPVSGKGITGRIINCTNLNVRAGAGTNYAKVAKLAKGTKVEILEYTKVGNATWGRIHQGWIHLYYVRLDAPLSDLDKKDEVDTDTDVDTDGDTNTGTGTGTGSGEGTGSGSGEGTGSGSGEGTGSGSGEGTGSGSGEGTDMEFTFSGKVVVKSTLKIRSGPGTNYSLVGTYNNGDKVTFYDMALVGKATWGKTDKGWISLYYVRPDASTSFEGLSLKKVITTANLYKDCSKTSKVLGTITSGYLVVVTEETVKAGGKTWALTPFGWIIVSNLS